jgi:hypothetical protein
MTHIAQSPVDPGAGVATFGDPRTIQKRAYGFQDEAYLRLKILTSTLPRR